MKVTCIFFVVLLNQLIGHCSTSRDEPSTSENSTALRRIPSDRSLRQLQVENVQLTEYKNGEMIELQQQDFFHLRKEAFRKSELFKDPQFPKELFINLGQEALRPKDIGKKPQEPVLFIDNGKPFHVKQGKLGDCWFVVGLLHLQYYPSLFKFIVQPYYQTFDVKKYAGIFHFRFWQAGIWVDVVIDDRLPTKKKKLVYASSGYLNEFWPALIEKAYAKLLYRSYEKLNAGFSTISMQDLSGGISELYRVKISSSNKLFKTIDNAKKRSTMISTVTGEKEHTSQFGLRCLHAYAITDVKIATGINVNHKFKLLRIHNPHGRLSNRYLGDIEELFFEETIRSQLKIKVDGEMWILYDDFIKYFEFVEICNLTPNSIIGDVYTKSGEKKLLLSKITGKFMGGINSREITDNFFEINPQFRVVLTESDYKNEECRILIGVSLKRRHDLEKFSKTPIAFHIISIDDDEMMRVPKPLSACSEKCKKIGRFAAKGQIGAHFDLAPGTYYIIPSVGETFKGATFHLQILSEHANILEVYDRDINMPQINEKIRTVTLEKFQETDRKLFFDMAITTKYENKKDKMIDFKGLYNILKHDKFSLNKNCHITQNLDKTVISELKLLATKILVPQRKLSYLTIAKTLLITQEAFEDFECRDFPGCIKTDFIFTAFKRNGYSINMDIFYAISARFENQNELIHFNDLMLIVFAIKNKIGSSCEEFNAKLCQDLVLMVHGSIAKFENFNDPQIHELRIHIQHFKLIIKFIEKLKEIFYNHSSKPYFSVAFAKLKNLFDAFDYKLTYDIIATVFHTHGIDDDIFYNQFVQSVVDVTLIFEKIQIYTSSEKGENLNKVYHKMFDQLWKKKQGKKYSFENNKRQADEPADNESPLKKIKI